MVWSNETLQKGMRLKFTCGATGYSTLLSEGYPLPSIRTIQRRLKNIDFKPGVLHNVFSLLKVKVCIVHPQVFHGYIIYVYVYRLSSSVQMTVTASYS